MLHFFFLFQCKDQRAEFGQLSRSNHRRSDRNFSKLGHAKSNQCWPNKSKRLSEASVLKKARTKRQSHFQWPREFGRLC